MHNVLGCLSIGMTSVVADSYRRLMKSRPFAVARGCAVCRNLTICVVVPTGKS